MPVAFGIGVGMPGGLTFLEIEAGIMGCTERPMIDTAALGAAAARHSKALKSPGGGGGGGGGVASLGKAVQVDIRLTLG